jgi:hypothetical protein
MSTYAELVAWFTGRIPGDWYVGPVTVFHDRDEILVIGELAEPDLAPALGEARAMACSGRIDRHREDTRDERVEISRDAVAQFGRTISWGARCGRVEKVFTNLSSPVMTRLRMRERQVLDTLVDAGVARSRSDALGWCVRLVAMHEASWLDDLRQALVQVEELRATGPHVPV